MYSFTDKENVEVAKLEYQKNIKVNTPVYIDHHKKRIGYVAYVKDNPITGLQMYVVTPQRANIANTNPASIKSAIVLFRGSTSPSIDFRNPSKMIDSIAYLVFNYKITGTEIEQKLKLLHPNQFKVVNDGNHN